MTAGVVEARFAPDLRRCPDRGRGVAAWTLTLLRVLPAMVVVGSAMLVSGCRHQPCQIAQGLTKAAIAKVALRMPEEEVRSLLGAPLSEYSEDDVSTSLIFAMPGGWRIAGMAGTVSSDGVACWVDIGNGMVQKAVLFEAGGESFCSCAESGCPTDWARACSGQLSE